MARRRAAAEGGALSRPGGPDRADPPTGPAGTATATQPAIEGRELRCAVGGREVLREVSIAVAPGERVAVVGPSGSGKTTLLTLLAGLVEPSGGRVLVSGRAAASGHPARGSVAIVLQGYGLVSLLTAAENVEVAARAAGVAPARAAEAGARVLARLGLEPFADHLVEELSGGQQQRVALARALVIRREVLLADEPTAEQDPVNRELVLDELLGTARAGTAVVIATHDPRVWRRCDRVVALAAGRLVDPPE